MLVKARGRLGAVGPGPVCLVALSGWRSRLAGGLVWQLVLLVLLVDDGPTEGLWDVLLDVLWSEGKLYLLSTLSDMTDGFILLQAGGGQPTDRVEYRLVVARSVDVPGKCVGGEERIKLIPGCRSR